MVASRRTVKDIPATAHFNFIYGAYHLSNWRIPYFATNMTFSQAADSLRLTSELPGSETIRWKLSELYQRDIDWPRVERQIVPYLRSQDNPQFFNSLTIALLPYDSEHAEILPEFAENHVWTPPDLVDPRRFAKILTIGPIKIGYWEDWSSIEDLEASTGQLRWNPQQIFAVALDGQHRLAAIKEALKPGGSWLSHLERSHVPIILVLFDERLGYHSPTPRPIVEVLRGVFIDLNKHARTVSRARQILLDDREPHAVCVRKVVGEQLTDHVDELKEHPPRLPLSLVDWHSEQARFDDGPYLTTVLGLDWIVTLLLATPPINDYTNYSSIRRQLSRLTSVLGVNLRDAERRLEELQAISQSPFSYTDRELDEVIANAFARIWAWPITHLLTEFLPYSKILECRREYNAFDLDFINWYPLYERRKKDKFEGRASQEYRQFLGRLNSRPESPISEQSLESKYIKINSIKDENLAFNVAFQRAYFEAFLEFSKIDDIAIDEINESDEEDYIPDLDEEEYYEDEVETVTEPTDSVSSLASLRRKRAEGFVEAMNRIVYSVPNFLKVEFFFEVENEGADNDWRFWLGSLQKPEGGIDFTQGASHRAADLIFSCVAMCLYDDLTEPDEASDFEEFWSKTMYPNQDSSSICRRISRAIKRYAGRENSAGGRILKAKGEDFDEDASYDQVYHRLKHIWEKLGL